MDEISEVKLGIFSGMHGIIDRALYLEQAIEDLIGVLSQAVPLATAAVVLKDAEVRYFATPSLDVSKDDMEQRMRSLCKSGLNMVSRIPQPFVLVGDNPMPLFLDRKAMNAIQKKQVSLFGCPIVFGDEVLGAILADRIFGDQVPAFEDVQFLSVLASFIAQLYSLEFQARRREEALARENLALRAKISEEHLGLICMGKSDAARKLESEIRKAAPSGAPVLLWGEPGTGKSSIGQIIHELSGRARFPFVKIHCSLPEDLLERDLFGPEKFLNSGANKSATAFDSAAGGTVLLDDISDLSTPHQVKLLDVLDSLHPMGAGAAGPKGINVRLIAAARADLFEAVSTGSFRKDLLNRLGTLLIHVPSIQERKEDIPFLIRHFLANACRERGRKVQLSGRVFKSLCEHDWPGNISEIKNAIIRLVIMTDGPEIQAEDLAPIFDPKRLRCPGSAEGIRKLSRLDQIERKEVSAALERNRWIRRKAARDLGLTFRQMNYRVKKFGLDSLIRENRTRMRDSS
jgi:Nif-specific regulatory protein